MGICDSKNKDAGKKDVTFDDLGKRIPDAEVVNYLKQVPLLSKPVQQTKY